MKTNLLLITAIATQSAACLAPMRVHVMPGLANQKNEITQEVRDVMNFMQGAYKLDENKWELGLKIVVHKEDLGEIPCPAGTPKEYTCFRSGSYTHGRNLLEVMWKDGTCNNSLIHELVHRMSFVEGYTDPFFGHGDCYSLDIAHNVIFHKTTEQAKELWRHKRGCK